MEDEQINYRFRILLFCTAIALLAAIVLSILQFGVPARENRMKVGFVLLTSKDDVGWNHSQYMGIRNACSELGLNWYFFPIYHEYLQLHQIHFY